MNIRPLLYPAAVALVCAIASTPPAGAANASAGAKKFDVASFSLPPAIGTIIERRKGGGDGTLLIIRHQQVQGLLHDYATMVGKMCALPPLAGSRTSLVVVSSDPDLRRQLAACKKPPVRIVDCDAASAPSFARLQNDVEPHRRVLAQIGEVVGDIRRECLPETLAAVLSKTDDFESGLLPLDDYAVFLARQCKKEQISLEEFPDVRAVLKVRHLENAIEPAKAESEMSRLLDNLLPRLGAADCARLDEAANAVTAGKLTRNAYYQMVRSYASRVGFSLSPYKHLKQYTAYLSETAGIRRHAVEEECDRICALIERRYYAEAAGD
ncbi:MAG TPA: hypothetical protein P5287_05575, partial [bacterium]|nr:hypothetical protein [bacterium]